MGKAAERGGAWTRSFSVIVCVKVAISVPVAAAASRTNCRKSCHTSALAVIRAPVALEALQ